MNLRGSEWLILLLIVLLLFGARRLPDMARGLGRSLRIFKAETKGLMNDDAAPSDASTTTATQAGTSPTSDSTQRDPSTHDATDQADGSNASDRSR
jgi:sec-independent protein translocase protein TatA